MGGEVDLNQMQIFAAISENQSFTKAAAQLKMDKSTVSTKLSQLESHLGVRLLNRSTRSVTLTEAGEGYFRYCQQILEIAKEAEQFATTLGDDAVGLLRVSATNTFSRFFITELIRPFLEENPQVEVELIMGYENIDLVGDQIDVALRLDVGSLGLKDSSLVARKFVSTEAGLFCSPSYMRKIEAITSVEPVHELEVIEFTVGHSFEVICQLVQNATNKYSIKSRFKVNDISSCKDAVIAGLGIVMLPNLAVKDELNNQQLVPLLADEILPMIDLYAVYPSRKYMPAKLKRFLEYLNP
jgi:DNA-binding transcriptional LysR family regulator